MRYRLYSRESSAGKFTDFVYLHSYDIPTRHARRPSGKTVASGVLAPSSPVPGCRRRMKRVPPNEVPADWLSTPSTLSKPASMRITSGRRSRAANPCLENREMCSPRPRTPRTLRPPPPLPPRPPPNPPLIMPLPLRLSP